MNAMQNRLSYVTQNVILGTVTGSMVAYNLRLIFLRVGGADLIWVVFFFIGPAIGYLSGKERQRMEKLKKEKTRIEESLSQIQDALKKSTKKYRLLVEHANDAIFLTTADGRFMLFNEATCNFSGYSKNELRKMNLSQLQMAEHVGDKEQKSWLDNGVHRYEDTWQNKSGNKVYLDVNARWIQMGSHQLILHIGRDTLRQNADEREEQARDIRQFHETKILETSAVQSATYARFTRPLANTIKLIQYLLQAVPEESERLSEVLADWGRTQKMTQWLPVKNQRDLKTTPCRWDLNEIIRQELLYLEMVINAKGFIKEMNLAKRLPMVFGFGRDFSIAFGTVFRAMWDSVKNTRQKSFSVATRNMDDHVVVEIHSQSSTQFEEHLCNVADPFFKEGDSGGRSRTETGFLACKQLFETMSAILDVGQEKGKGTLVRVRVPSIQDDSIDSQKHAAIVEEAKQSLII